MKCIKCGEKMVKQPTVANNYDWFICNGLIKVEYKNKQGSKYVPCGHRELKLKGRV